jgi:hypothetical protein
MSVTTSNVGCWRWVGTASVTTNTSYGAVTVESASVVYDRYFLPGTKAEDLQGVDLFKSTNSGTATFNISGRDTISGCTYSGSGTSALQGDGRLLADSGILVSFLLPDPTINRVMLGEGTTVIPAVTITCGKEVSTSDQSVRWLSVPKAGAALSDDGQTIAGRWARTESGDTKTSVWNFTAVREP